MFKLIFSILCTFLISCTQQGVQKSTQTKNLKLGPYPYTLKEKTSKIKDFAQIGNYKIEENRIESNSPGIKELKQQLHEYSLAFIYRQARESLTTDSESQILTYYIEKPRKDLAEILKQLEFELDDRITVEFSDEKPDPSTDALFGSTNINLAEVKKNNLKYQRLLNEIFKQKLNGVRKAITKVLLFKHIKKNKINIEQFINEKIFQKNITLSDLEFEEHIKQNNLTNNINTEDLRERIRSIALEKKKNFIIESYVAKNLLKDELIIYASPMAFKLDIKKEWSPMLGPAENTKHSLIMFSQINCDACKNLLNTIVEVAKERSDTKAYYFYNLRTWDRDQRLIAEASMCAHLQKNFWPFIQHFTQADVDFSEAEIYNSASSLKIEQDKFKSCFLARKTKDAIDYHLKYSKYLGIAESPTLVIDGSIYSGTSTKQDILDALARSAGDGSNSRTVQNEGIIKRVINFIKNLFS